MCPSKFDECPDCQNYCDKDACAECDAGELFEEKEGVELCFDEAC